MRRHCKRQCSSRLVFRMSLAHRLIENVLRNSVKGVLKIDQNGGAKPDHLSLFFVGWAEFAEALERRPAPPVGRCV